MILSISAIASAGITKPAAFMLFSSWLGLEAPAITQLLQDPCHGKHRQVRAELVGHLAQLLDLVEVLIGQQIVDLVVGLPGGA